MLLTKRVKVEQYMSVSISAEELDTRYEVSIISGVTVIKDGQTKGHIFANTLLDLWEDLSGLWTCLGNTWKPIKLYSAVPLDSHAGGRRWKKLVGPCSVSTEEEVS